VAIFNFWVVLRINVIAPQTEADDSAFGFGAAAFATGPFAPPLDERRVGLRRHRFRYTPLLLGLVLFANAKLDGAFAVVVSLHGKTADAFAVLAALPVVPGLIAVVTVAHCSPNLPLMRLRAFDALHL
jgi:hypothetical protein